MNTADQIEMATALGIPLLPVQIRPDVTVIIGPLPLDLTKAEAQRIANIVLAHAEPKP